MIGAIIKALTGDNAKWFVLAFVVAGVVTWSWLDGLQHGQDKANTAWQAKWNDQVNKLANERNAAIEHYLAEQKRLNDELETVRNESIKQIEQARTDAAAADAVAVGMHEQARRLAARASQCTTDTTASIRSKAATATNQLLADLFERADAAAGTMAAAYDRARAAGLACERAYDAVRNTKQPTTLR